MQLNHNEMLSSLGYDALRVILGIDPDRISEKDVKRLIRLIILSEEDNHLQSNIQRIVQQYRDQMPTKVALLLRLEKEYSIKREGGI